MIPDEKFVFAPVLVPTLNRYDHFVRLVESLQKCKYADRTELVIGLDYPPSHKYEEGYNRIKKYLDNGINGFGEIHIIYHEKNVGQGGNLLSMREYISNKYDRYIITEDDNVFAYSFLSYMNAMLEKYKDSNEVLLISGFSYPVNWVDNQGLGVIKEQSFFSEWGFGAYISKREKIMNYYSSGYYLREYKEKKLAWKVLKKSKKNFCYYIDGIWKKNLSATDVGESIYLLCNDKYCVMPLISLVRNEGWDGSGRHCENDDRLGRIFINQKIDEEGKDWFAISNKENIQSIKENEIIINRFFKASYIEQVKAIVKWVLISIEIIVKKR